MTWIVFYLKITTTAAACEIAAVENTLRKTINEIVLF